MESAERRKFSRITVGDEPCTLTVNGVPHSASLLDQSIDGLRVEGIPLLVFTSNVPMTLLEDGVATKVACRNVSRISKNEFALGLMRVESNSDDYVPQIFVNPYVRLNGLSVLCSPLNSDDSNLLVELPGKKEFRISSDLIETRLRHERLQELRAADYLNDLATFYSRATGRQVAPNFEAIVNFEFGRAISTSKMANSNNTVAASS